MKAKFKLLAIFSVSLLSMLSMASFFSYEIQKIEQEEFATDVLGNAELVTSQLVTVLTTANSIEGFTCNKDNINKLRELVMTNSEIFDAGFMKDDTVYCTANWGEIKPTKLRYQDSGEQNGYQFYSNEENLYRISEHYNLTAKGNFFAVNITTSYSRVLKKLPQFQFQIYSKTVDNIFDEYAPAKKSNSYFALTLSTDACSKVYGFCVRTINDRAGLPYYSIRSNTIVFIVILTISYLITHLLQLIISNRQTIEARFRTALSEESLFMEYQPIVRIGNGRVEAVESLVRWTDDVYGRVSPELFISIAEKLSLYPELAHFTAKRAISDMASVLRNDPQFSCAINICSYEIREHAFLEYLVALVRSHDINPSQIKIEITESIDVELIEIAEFSARAQALGFMVVLDDFGTGVSNLVWLTEVNFDYIKIDRVFVNALNFDIKKGMASAIMDLVASLGKEVVFEGVETKREYDMITEHCKQGYVQGWYFYRSLPLTELLTVLNNKKSS
ncbi:EAL domain-containing protein [Vibrio parahaemolyticus]|nr:MULTISPECIES: EAL domain-containing protein [Vibrio]MCA2422558.1 EAL domain-containing protein [Vibrio alginolyticus]MCA2447188.1 EAL domain-containing protein [Vibrio alginolyticus]MCI9701973.1 EAL domain-containing protein [Vibrio parahaemolyticus]MCR9814378.1 EAL domain-containing protein [Vibrio parahaemolyticus]MDF4316584.1 EAL domain-containing protein [Vibrio parahaemolyticus]